MKPNMILAVFCLIILTIPTSCERYDYPVFKVDKELILELNSKVTDLLTVDSNDYFLDAFLWRDFMPICPPDGRPLTSINWLISADSSAIPAYIELKQQYVISGDSVWISDYVNENNQTPEYKLEKVSRNGPKWGPFVYVDVIARVTDTRTNTDYYLKKGNVIISRTD